MKLGPVEISNTGVWLNKPGARPQNITVPAIAGAVILLFVLCCCARVVS